MKAERVGPAEEDVKARGAGAVWRHNGWRQHHREDSGWGTGAVCGAPCEPAAAAAAAWMGRRRRAEQAASQQTKTVPRIRRQGRGGGEQLVWSPPEPSIAWAQRGRNPQRQAEHPVLSSAERLSWKHRPRAGAASPARRVESLPWGSARSPELVGGCQGSACGFRAWRSAFRTHRAHAPEAECAGRGIELADRTDHGFPWPASALEWAAL